MSRPRIVVSALALVFVLGAAPLALAQPRDRPAPAPTGENVTRYGENAFEPSNVEGTRRTSMGERVVGRVAGHLAPLVRARPDFYRELTKSVESL